MKEIIREEQVKAYVKKEIPIYITTDGKEYKGKESAENHEELLKKCPKLEYSDIDWLEGFIDQKETEDFENFQKAFASDDVILLMDHSGGEDLCFIVVDPVLKAVEAVIKALHRKTIGCNYNLYIYGVVYKTESLCFSEPGKSFTTGKGRNIKDVLN